MKTACLSVKWNFDFNELIEKFLYVTNIIKFSINAIIILL